MGSLMYKKPDRMFVYYHLQRNGKDEGRPKYHHINLAPPAFLLLADPGAKFCQVLTLKSGKEFMPGHSKSHSLTHLENEIGRRSRPHRGPQDPVMMRVNKCFIQI